MRITVLRRGGLSVYGGSYDTRKSAAIADVAMTQAVEVVFPDEIQAVTVSSDGASATTPTVSGKKASFTLSGSGAVSLIATMGDERPAVRIETPRQGGNDYGTA